jgi:hypothetical protein
MSSEQMFDYFQIIEAVSVKQITPKEAEERFSYLITNEKEGKKPIGYWPIPPPNGKIRATMWEALRHEIASAGMGGNIRFMWSPRLDFHFDNFGEDLEDDAVVIYERFLPGTPLYQLRSVEDIAELVLRCEVTKEQAEAHINWLLQNEIEERDVDEIAFVHPFGAEDPERLWIFIGSLFVTGKITGINQVWMNLSNKKIETGAAEGRRFDRMLLS